MKILNPTIIRQIYYVVLHLDWSIKIQNDIWIVWKDQDVFELTDGGWSIVPDY